MSRRTIALYAAAIGLWAASAVAQPSDRRSPSPVRDEVRDVQVKTSVSRTAVWVGDAIDLVVEFSSAPNVDVITEDLARDKLKLHGLEATGSSSERVVAGDGSVAHRFRYRLTSYDVGTSALRVDAWPVRYYVRRAGERPEDATPVGEVQVPGVAIARRSTLPDEIPALDLRDTGELHGVPTPVRVARPIGIGLIVLSAAPLAVWAAALVRRSRSRVRIPSARTVRAQARTVLEELRVLDTVSESSRREAYGRLEQAVRRHLAETRGIPAQALCAGEVAARLEASGSAQGAAAGELLAECERARYAPPDRVPSHERFSAALAAAERIVGGARS